MKQLKFKVIAVDYDGTLEPLDKYGNDSYPSVVNRFPKI